MRGSMHLMHVVVHLTTLSLSSLDLPDVLSSSIWVGAVDCLAVLSSEKLVELFILKV
jgi:hypothetical protein